MEGETKEEKAAKAQGNPDKAGMVHGRVEHQVQKRTTGFPTLARAMEKWEGYHAMYDGGFGDVMVTDACGALQGADDMAKKRMFFNMLKHDNAGPRRQLKADELIPISNALYALSKLFSGAGDHKRYFLNEGDLLNSECKCFYCGTQNVIVTIVLIHLQLS